MRQIKRFPADKHYKFGLHVDRFSKCIKASGEFISEEDIKKYEVGEQFLEPKGTERKNWDNEIPENANIIMFEVEVEIEGEDKEEKQRMIRQFEGEFKDYIRQKGITILKVVSVQVIKKRKKKE